MDTVLCVGTETVQAIPMYVCVCVNPVILRVLAAPITMVTTETHFERASFELSREKSSGSHTNPAQEEHMTFTCLSITKLHRTRQWPSILTYMLLSLTSHCYPHNHMIVT